MHTMTVMSQNAQYGALAAGRWNHLVDVIRDVGPTVLLLQEVDWLTEPGHAAQAAADLGMELVVAPSRNLPTAVAWNPQVLELEEVETRYAGELHHGYCAPRFRVDGLQAPLVVISAHLTPYSAAQAAQEAQLLVARLYRYGGLGVLGGDINHCPVRVAGEPEPDWAAMKPYNRTSRCVRREHPGQAWRGNEIVGRTLADGDLVDVAAAVAIERGDLGLLAPTGRHGGLRVDQLHVTPALAGALRDYRRVDPGAGSDHFGVVATVDLAAVDAAPLITYT